MLIFFFFFFEHTYSIIHTRDPRWTRGNFRKLIAIFIKIIYHHHFGISKKKNKQQQPIDAIGQIQNMFNACNTDNNVRDNIKIIEKFIVIKK